MKIDIILTLMSLVIAGLLAFGVHVAVGSTELSDLMTYGSSICFALTLIPLMGIKYDNTRIGVNIRVLTVIVIISMLISQFGYAFYGNSAELYIIINGIILLIFLALFYKMQGTKNI